MLDRRVLTDGELGDAIGAYFDQVIVGLDARHVSERAVVGRDRRAPGAAWARPIVVVALLAALLLAGYQAARFIGSVTESFERSTPVLQEFATAHLTLSRPGGIGSPGLVVQTDGRILVARLTASEIVIRRLEPNGTPDEGFGSDGQVRISHGWSATVAAVAFTPDGSVVLLGEEPSGGFSLSRQLPDGTLDATFGAGGRVFASFDGIGNTAVAVAVQPDGKIVVAGSTGGTQPGSGGLAGVLPERIRFALARFTIDGSLDLQFGDDGQVSRDIAKGADAAASLLIQSDGRIVVVGSTGSMTAGGLDNDMAIARWNPNGTADDSFGVDGEVQVHLPSTLANVGNAAVLASGGRIVMVGHVSEPVGLGIVRLFPNGEIDSSFADAGFASHASAGPLLSVSVQPDGRVLVAGGSAVLRFNVDGSLDTTFGVDGVADVVP